MIGPERSFVSIGLPIVWLLTLAACSADTQPSSTQSANDGSSALHAACTRVAEEEARTDGDSGCDCMVARAAGNAGVRDELITASDLPIDQRRLSDEAFGVVAVCFNLTDEEIESRGRGM